jgi:hypothetical protein
MRMKSNGMFWLEVNAEGMLLLRSYLKGAIPKRGHVNGAQVAEAKGTRHPRC